MSATNGSPLMVGASVWIQSGLGPQQEPGTVLALHVPLEHGDDNEEGVRVRLHTSSHESVVGLDRVQTMNVSSPTHGHAAGPRRSSRRSTHRIPRSAATTAVVTPNLVTSSSSSTGVDADEMPRSCSKKGNKRNSSVAAKTTTDPTTKRTKRNIVESNSTVDSSVVPPNTEKSKRTVKTDIVATFVASTSAAKLTKIGKKTSKAKNVSATSAKKSLAMAKKLDGANSISSSSCSGDAAEDALLKLSRNDLKKKCSELSLPVSGLKADLVKRIAAATFKESKETNIGKNVSTETTKEDMVTTKKNLVSKLDSTDNISSSDSVDTAEEQLLSHSKIALRKKCSELNISMSGTKAELAKRITKSSMLNETDASNNMNMCIFINEPSATAKKTAGGKRSRKKMTNIKKSVVAALPPSANDNSEDDDDEESAVQIRNVPVPGAPDGHGGLDQPSEFSIAYSPTGRATCRRCDQLILKQQLRVSHRPLFRGKPGFTVYRHLHCAMFSDKVTLPTHVDGHETLQPEDRTKLVTRIAESLVELQVEQEELQPDELVQECFQGEIRPNPPGLQANLLPFQLEGFSWMVGQEVKETVKGGILADEMGMGKTIQTICTMLDNRPKLQHAVPGAKFPPGSDHEALLREESLWEAATKDWRHEMTMNSVPSHILPKHKGTHRAGTLVICPVIALFQWKTEIEKFTSSSTALTVGIYHGPDRAKNMPPYKMKLFDVILTTYQVLEQDMRKMISPNKVKCPNCGAKFKVDKLGVHLKYFCGATARRTEAQSRQRRGGGHRGGGDGDGGSSNMSSSKGKKAAPFTKTFSKTKQKSAESTKSFKAKEVSKSRKGRKKVQTDSDTTSEEEADLKVNTNGLTSSISSATTERPSRKAASQASKRLSHSVNTWGGNNDSDDGDDFKLVSSSDGGSSEDEVFSSSDDESILLNSVKKKKISAKSRYKKSDSEENSSDSDSADADDATGAEKRATAKQKEALQLAQGKRMPKKKRFVVKKKRKRNDPPDDLGVDMDALVKDAMAGANMSILHSLCWWRIVLDEAHFIKSRSSQTAHAAFSLIGIHRWCLSGTPLQNRVGEFYSLIRFLRIDPMALYVCKSKNCTCKSFHYRMLNGKCRDCGHGSVNHYSHFNRYVLNPIQRDGYSGDGRRAMFTLKNDVLDKVLLRRTKDSRAEDMNLPPRIVTIRTVRLHPIEEDFYNALYTQTRSSFNDYVADGTLLNNYAHIFDLLMRMRQSVDHPYLTLYSKKECEKNALTSSSAGGKPIANGTIDCEICHEPPIERIVSSCCQSAFCKTCVIDYMTTSAGIETSTARAGAQLRAAPCPSCHEAFSIDLNQIVSQENDAEAESSSYKRASEETGVVEVAGMPSLKSLSHVSSGSILRRINLANFATSTKIEALTEELVKMRNVSPGSKAIIFSQFVSMIDLIRWRLHSDPCLANMGLGARALHGGMDVKARDTTLREFREDSNVRVLLMSLKAGGVALNLTVANYIYLMDPWWNPAAEMQAIDRTHRLGQYRPIRAVRFIAENTVEERILQLQEKKRLVFDGTVGRDAGSLKMLTVDDMKSLFC